MVNMDEINKNIDAIEKSFNRIRFNTQQNLF